MEAMQMQPVSRWCRGCGLPSPVTRPNCVHCGTSAALARGSKSRNLSKMLNQGNGSVQNNVISVEHLQLNGLSLFGDGDNDKSEPALPALPPAPAQESGLRRFLMFTCAVAMWSGIITVVSVFAFFVVVVVLAYQHAHGIG